MISFTMDILHKGIPADIDGIFRPGKAAGNIIVQHQRPVQLRIPGGNAAVPRPGDFPIRQPPRIINIGTTISIRCPIATGPEIELHTVAARAIRRNGSILHQLLIPAIADQRPDAPGTIRMSDEDFAKAARAFAGELTPEVEEKWTYLASLLKPRISRYNEIPGQIGFFSQLPDYDTDLFNNKRNKVNPEKAAAILPQAMEALEPLTDWTPEAIDEKLEAVIGASGLKMGTFMPWLSSGGEGI